MVFTAIFTAEGLRYALSSFILHKIPLNVSGLSCRRSGLTWRAGLDTLQNHVETICGGRMLGFYGHGLRQMGRRSPKKSGPPSDGLVKFCTPAVHSSGPSTCNRFLALFGLSWQPRVSNTSSNTTFVQQYSSPKNRQSKGSRGKTSPEESAVIVYLGPITCHR